MRCRCSSSPSPRLRRGTGPRRRTTVPAPTPPPETRPPEAADPPRPPRREAEPHRTRSAVRPPVPRRLLPASRAAGPLRTRGPQPAPPAPASAPRVSALPQRWQMQRYAVVVCERGEHPHRDVEVVSGIRKCPQRLGTAAGRSRPNGSARRGARRRPEPFPPSSRRDSAPAARPAVRHPGRPPRRDTRPRRRERSPRYRRPAVADPTTGGAPASTTPLRTCRPTSSPAVRRARRSRPETGPADSVRDSTNVTS